MIQILPFRAYDSKLQVTRDFRLGIADDIGLITTTEKTDKSSMKLFFLFLLFSFSLSQAEENKSGSYLDKKNLPTELKTDSFANAKSSVIYLMDKRNASEIAECSLVVTSSSCYALTAAHCLFSHLEKRKILKWSSIPSSPLLQKGAVNLEKINGLKLGLRFLPSNKKNNFRKNENIQLISMPTGQFQDVSDDGLALPLSPNAESIFNDFKKNNDGFLADYALIKLPGSQCTCSNTADFKENEKVIAIGFGGEITTPIVISEMKHLSDEEWQEALHPLPSSNVSLGKQCSLAPSLDKQKSIGASFFKFLTTRSESPQILQNKKLMYDLFKDQIIFHNARVEPGTSGGGLFNFNSEHELLGINSFGTNINSENGFGASISTKYIKEQLQKSLPPEIYSEAFNCEKPAP